MSYRFYQLLGIVFAIFLQPTIGQQTHLVEVGAQGSFFVPANISAQVNDTVRFYFAAATHAVIQSSLNNPCAPLPGGFSSGKVSRKSDSVAAQIWDLIITDATEPIWFYCGTADPVNHCTTGMVGAINPPSVQFFQQFINIAKNSANPVEYDEVSLNGHGAKAIQPPGPNPTFTPVVTSTMSSTPQQSTTADPFDSSGHGNAAIIGGSVGGVLGFIILGFTVPFLVRRCRRAGGCRNQLNSDEFFRYRGGSIELGKYTPPSRPGSNKPDEMAFVPSRMTAPPRQRFPRLAIRRSLRRGPTPPVIDQQTTAVLLVQQPATVAGRVPLSTTAPSVAIGILSAPQNGTRNEISLRNNLRSSTPSNNLPPLRMPADSRRNLPATPATNPPSTGLPPPNEHPRPSADERPSSSGSIPPPTSTPSGRSSVHAPPVGGNPSQRAIRALPRLPSSAAPSPPSTPLSAISQTTSGRPPLRPLPPSSAGSTPSMLLAVLGAKGETGSNDRWMTSVDSLTSQSDALQMRSSASSQVLGGMETPPPSYYRSQSNLRQTGHGDGI